MNLILENNLKLLEKYQPEVYNKVLLYGKAKYQPVNKHVERVLLARQDDIIINMLVVAGGMEYILCDHEDPIGEAYAWIDKYIDPSNKVDIVFGMGFGYHLEVLVTSFKDKKVVIVEPNMDLFYQIASIRNLAPIIEKSEIYLDEPVEAVLSRVHNFLWDTNRGGIQCQPFEIYAEIFADCWDELRSKFIKQAQNFSVDMATRRHFGELWAHNNIKNADRLISASHADGLVGKFKNIPGILVSSGPSLKKNIHFLKDLRSSCVIMAAGYAVKELDEQGIMPHFMVGIDASDKEAQMHENIKNNEIYFVYSNQVATGSVEHYTGPKFFMNYPVDIYTAQFLNFAGIKSEVFLSGPSVANTCVDLLYKMGCNPIILLGQDLSYTKEALAPEGDISPQALRDQGLFQEKDIYGNTVYTNMAFTSMKNWFEGYFERIKDQVEVINATEGGLNIQYTQNDSLECAVKPYKDQQKDIGRIIKEIYENNRFPNTIKNQLDDYKKEIEKEIKVLEDYAQEQLKIVELIRKDVYHPSKNKKDFDKMVGRVSELTELVMGSKVYMTLLKNIVDIEFYLIKLEVERATKELKNYRDVKNIYIEAMKRQSEILLEKVGMIKKYLF